MFLEFAWNAALIAFLYLAWRHVTQSIAHNEGLMDKLAKSGARHEEISREMRREFEAHAKKVDALRHLIDLTQARYDRLDEIAKTLRQYPTVAAAEEKQAAREKALEASKRGEELVGDAVSRFVIGV